ncbi:MAG: hypothetical protein WC877_03305 [Dehalococcoidales bacterium]|jgi:hypothetical protein|nr:hypothetical protein [Candidatus Neomarinimicrobiota bacterium]
MARIKIIDGITFKSKNDPVLMAKLNSVAPYLYRNVHDAARLLLNTILDQKISEYNITVDYSKSTQSPCGD